MLKVKRMVGGLVVGLSLLVLTPGDASAAVCANAVNASVLGDASQENDCETNVTSSTPSP